MYRIYGVQMKFPQTDHNADFKIKKLRRGFIVR